MIQRNKDRRYRCRWCGHALAERYMKQCGDQWECGLAINCAYRALKWEAHPKGWGNPVFESGRVE